MKFVLSLSQAIQVGRKLEPVAVSLEPLLKRAQAGRKQKERDCDEGVGRAGRAWSSISFGPSSGVLTRNSCMKQRGERAPSLGGMAIQSFRRLEDANRTPSSN